MCTILCNLFLAMRCALLGSHPDGLEIARALAESGRHQLALYSGPAAGTEYLRPHGLSPKTVGDLEEVLADPAIEAVIVAGGLADRPAQLRRALQSERHVLCVQPPNETPDIAYEAAMILGDTRKLLLPLLPDRLHPAILRLSEIIRGPLGGVRLLELKSHLPPDALVNPRQPGQKAGFPHWDVLRALGGEIAEVSAFAAREYVEPGEPVLLAGRFEQGGLFQVTLVPKQSDRCWRLRMTGNDGQAELHFPDGWSGPACLTWSEETEKWEAWNPWPALVEAFDRAVSRGTPTTGHRDPTWQDATRCQELDDAARRSLERRRTSLLDYQEVSEEVGFNGTMTLVGYGLLWWLLLLAILSAWFPKVGWLILPVLGVFLVLQLLRWVIPRSKGERRPEGDR